MATHKGRVDWYSEEGFGVIRDGAGIEYFVHSSGLAQPQTGLLQGQVVLFDARARKHGRAGLEAFDVVVQSMTAEPANVVETAAAEILRFRCEQRLGEKREQFDPFGICHKGHDHRRVRQRRDAQP